MIAALGFLKAVPWRLVGIIAGALLLIWIGHRVRVSYTAEAERDEAREELVTERKQFAANIGAIAQDISENERERTQLATRLDAIDSRFDNLRIEFPDASQFVQTTEVPNAPCPRVGISAATVELWNRASTEAGLTEAKAH